MLTLKEEKYVQELVKGKSQREAYRAAYPNSKKWPDKTVDERACKLFNQYKVNAIFYAVVGAVNKR
jgi:phage terminase small subunit